MILLSVITSTGSKLGIKRHKCIYDQASPLPEKEEDKFLKKKEEEKKRKIKHLPKSSDLTYVVTR